MRPGPDKHSLGQLSGLSTRISALHYNRHHCWTNKVGKKGLQLTNIVMRYEILKSFALKLKQSKLSGPWPQKMSAAV